MQKATLARRAGAAAPRLAVRAAPSSRRAAVAVRASGTPYPQNWLPKDALALGLGVIGWTLPSTIGVSAFGGQSLFGLLTQSIGEELAHFPTGPALGDKFWCAVLDCFWTGLHGLLLDWTGLLHWTVD